MLFFKRYYVYVLRCKRCTLLLAQICNLCVVHCNKLYEARIANPRQQGNY